MTDHNQNVDFIIDELSDATYHLVKYYPESRKYHLGTKHFDTELPIPFCSVSKKMLERKPIEEAYIVVDLPTAISWGVHMCPKCLQQINSNKEKYLNK